MSAARIDPETQIPTALTYTDPWGEKEAIFAREGLCTRAGCKCVQGHIVCNNFEYPFFILVLHTWYSDDCFNTCTCKTVTPTKTLQMVTLRNTTVDSRGSPDSAESGHIVNTVNPSNSSRSASWLV